MMVLDNDVITRKMLEARYAIRTYGDMKEELKGYEKGVEESEWNLAVYYGDSLKSNATMLKTKGIVPDDVSKDLIDSGQQLKVFGQERKGEDALEEKRHFLSILDSGRVMTPLIKYVRRPSIKAIRESIRS